MEIQYEKKAGEGGWFGSISDKLASEDDLNQMLAYNEPEERVLVGKTHDAKPSYYLLFVSAYLRMGPFQTACRARLPCCESDAGHIK